MIPIYKIKIPEYDVKSKPDWKTIGTKIDLIIKKYFLDKKIVIRCLSSKNHKNKSIHNLIKIINRIGHDRYDPKRKGDRYENVKNKKIDIFGLDFIVKDKSVIMKKFIEPFYNWPISVGEKPIRLEIVIIYDRFKLKKVLHKYKGRKDTKRDGFIFKNQENKKEALLGIIKILK